jgi:hypothetical protein
MTLGLASPTTNSDDIPWDELAAEFGATLGLDGPAPRRTLEAALADETYADNLLASRRHPTLLKQLIELPPRVRGAGAPPPLSSVALARRATLALARWAGTGFATVSAAVRQRREAACVACPHRLPATTTLGHCGLCGCPLGRKIRMTSEACPDPHPSNAGETRWGESAVQTRSDGA